MGQGTLSMNSRVAVVVSHPIQHFCPLYRALAQSGRVDLKVFFGSKDGLNGYFDPGFNRVIQWEGDLVAGFPHEFLPGAGKVSVTGSVDSPHVASVLSAFDPDVVLVYGFWHGISRRAISWARSHGRQHRLTGPGGPRSRARPPLGLQHAPLPTDITGAAPGGPSGHGRSGPPYPEEIES